MKQFKIVYGAVVGQLYAIGSETAAQPVGA